LKHFTNYLQIQRFYYSPTMQFHKISQLSIIALVLASPAISCISVYAEWDGNKHQASYTFLVTAMFMLTCCAATNSFHPTLNDNRRKTWWVGPLRIGSGVQGIIFACSGGRGSNSATLWLNSGEVEYEHGGFDS
jgi:hypothetical protein